ncbi:MAG TPA: biotin/lipoyl-binding protein, partial [Oculatellaceae cyanobacterium]
MANALSKFQTRRLALFISLGVITLIGLGAWWWSHMSTRIKTDDAMVAGHLHPVSPRVPGTVTAVHVLENQMVKAGQLLVQLDDRDYQAQVLQAEAALATAKARAQAAESNIPLSQAQYQAQVTQASGGLSAATNVVAQSEQAIKEAKAAAESAEHNLAEAEAQLTKAQQDLQRYNSVDPRAVSA